MNCAHRLLEICKELSFKEGQSHNGIRVRLAKILNIQEKDNVGLYLGLAKIHQLADDVEKQIKSIPGIPHDAYLQGIADVKVFANHMTMENMIGGHTRLIGPTTQAVLALCAVELDRYAAEPDIEAAVLAEIAKQTQKLIETVLKSDLEPMLRSTLLNLLEAIRRAIAEYRFHGVDGLRQELFLIFDRLQRNVDVFERNKEKPEVQGFWVLVAKLDSLTSLALNVQEIVGKAAPFLPAAMPLMLEAAKR